MHKLTTNPRHENPNNKEMHCPPGYRSDPDLKGGPHQVLAGMRGMAALTGYLQQGSQAEIRDAHITRLQDPAPGPASQK